MFTPAIKQFFIERQEFWIQYFKNSPLIHTLNKMSEPICQTYFDLLQGTFGATVSNNDGKVLAALTKKLGSFPYLGRRLSFNNLFTVNLVKNPTNPGRLDQRDTVFLTMRKEFFKSMDLSLMLLQGYGPAFHSSYSFGNLDIKAAHTYVVVALMRKKMPMLTDLLKQIHTF